MQVRFRSLAVAALVSGCLIPGVTIARDASAQEVTTDARAHFSAGVNLLRDPANPRYEEAYREFKAAYQIAPITKILGNLGLCAMMLERDAEAIDAYDKYLKGSIDLDGAEREQIERDLSTLKITLAKVTVSSNVKGVTLVDQRIRTQGQPVTNVYGPIDGPTTLGIRQGHHVFTARAPGKPEVTWEVDAPAGELPAHAFDFPVEEAPVTPKPNVFEPPPPPPNRPVPSYVWYAAGGTGAVAVGGLVTGLFASSTNSTFKEANDGRNPERAESLRGTGQTLNVVSDALFTTAIIGAAVTTVLYLTRPEVKLEMKKERQARARLPGPRLNPYEATP